MYRIIHLHGVLLLRSSLGKKSTSQHLPSIVLSTVGSSCVSFCWDTDNTCGELIYIDSEAISQNPNSELWCYFPNLRVLPCFLFSEGCGWSLPGNLWSGRMSTYLSAWTNCMTWWMNNGCFSFDTYNILQAYLSIGSTYGIQC